MRRLLIVLTTCAGLAVPAAARADDSWYASDANFSQAFITSDSSEGTATLHADVLRPKNVPDGTKVPVILSIGPYFNHTGQTGPTGPVEDTSYDPVSTSGHAEASDRFRDFVVDSGLLKKGYALMLVDLRGFGGSSGCLDWAGPGEQADVKNAVEWAASQSWSSGKVGMYGKSYDGVTGLIGEAQQPKGLAAVVSQEPVYDLYRYLYSDGVRYENSLATPALYDAIASTPGQVGGDDLNYLGNSANDPACLTQNYLAQAANSDHTSDYWKARNLIAEAKGKATPLFLTQGFLENNTKPDGAWDFFNELTGPKRAWFGMWDHIRGNETAEGTDIETPSSPAPHHWTDEVMSFYDQYLKGVTPTSTLAPVEIQDDTGAWRNAQSFPEADADGLKTTLNDGSYTDASNVGSNDGGALNPAATTGQGVWTFSPPLTHEVHLSGVPSVTLTTTASMANATLSVDVYDVDPASGMATILSRTARALASGTSTVSPEMYGNDWIIPAGHRLGVLVTSANAEWWTAETPTGATVTVKNGSITLPFLRYTRPDTFSAKKADRLAEFKKDAPIPVSAATISAGTRSDFAVPPAQTEAPAGFPTSGGAGTAGGAAGASGTGAGGGGGAKSSSSSGKKAARPRVTRLRWQRHGLLVTGRGTAGTKLRLLVRRHGRTVSRRTVTVRKTGSFKILLRVRHIAGSTVGIRGGIGRKAPR